MIFSTIVFFIAVNAAIPNSMRRNYVNAEANYLEIEQLTPTVHPADPFRPSEDAQVLYTALNRRGTDEQVIIDLLSHRTLAQRRQIAQIYALKFKVDLITDINDDLDHATQADLLEAIQYLLTDRSRIYACALHDAVDAMRPDGQKIINVLVPLTNNEIYTVAQFYRDLYNKTLKGALHGKTSDDFRDFILALADGKRNETQIIDPEEARKTVTDFQRTADEYETKTLLMKILITTSYPQLRRIFDEYKQFTGHNIEEAIDENFSGDAENGLLAIVKFARDKNAYFAEVLYNAIAGFGTNEEELTRVIVTRSERDLGNIKKAYQGIYRVSLQEDVMDDTSGHYEKVLLALLGP